MERWKLAFLIGLGCQVPMASAQLRSFGDAEGYGAAASGGRAITSATSIYHVTNLNDSGTGSFRDAVSGSNRIVVFDVGGEIKLTSGGISSQGNITIAGQTAPGAGITITGYQAIGFTSRSNVIMRYLRLRPGDSSPASDNGMSMTKTGTAILDHVSIEFGKYNNIDAVADTTDAPRITIQHSIIADPISTGTDTRGQGFGAHLEAVNGYYTISNNLWANSHSRNPLAKVNDQFKNNVEYNNEIGYLTSGTTTPFKHDLVNNAFIAGPDYTSSSDYGQLSTPDKFYAVGNVQDANQNGVFDPTTSNPLATIANSATPYHATTTALPTLSVTDAYAYVLAHAGSSLSRDALDNLVIGQVQTLGSGTAGYTVGTTGPTSTTVPFDMVHEGLYWKAYLTGLSNGGLGDTAGASRAANFDVDNDGVADAWEATHGMSGANAADAVKTNALGYLMVEQYVNELGDQNATAAWTDAAVAPGPYTHATLRGNGTTNGSLTFNTSVAGAASTPAPQALSLSIGGNGPAAGEVVTVAANGRLNVYDTITVGEFGNATLNVTGGTLGAWNIQLGNTDYSAGTGSGTSYNGTLNFSAGTLNVSQIAPGGGSPGAFTSNGAFNWSGGTLVAAGGYSVTAPTTVTGVGDVLNANGFDGTLANLVGGGTITKTGAGTLTLAGNNVNFNGTIKLNAGAVSLVSTAAGSYNGGVGVLLANGTSVNVVTSNTAIPITLAAAATATIVGNSNTYGGTINGPAGSTLVVSSASTGSSNFSLGGFMTSFAGTLDLGASTGNVRINQGGSALANFNLGTSTGVLRPAFDGTVNLGSLSGASTTKLQGSTNGTSSTTFSVGANGASTTFSGIVADGTSATPSITYLTKVGAGTLSLANAASTYSGVTTINGGVLAAATLANGGAASSIGVSNSAATSLVIDGGTLRHTGAAATTDRLFTLGANGGAIEASGTGALVFGTVGTTTFTGVGDRTLTLGGTNTAFNGLSADLYDPAQGGKLSLVKDGVGTWRLLGNPKIYTGGTTINAGTLYLVGTNLIASGAGRGDISIAAGATLDIYGNSQTVNGLNGAGTVTTTLNTARTLTVGNGNASGTFSGTLTQGAGRTLALTKIGTGTQTLSGTDTYTGSTIVNGGTLKLARGLRASNSLTIAAGARASVLNNGVGSNLGTSDLSTFSLAGGATPTATFDLGDNAAVLRNATLAAVYAQTRQAFEDGGNFDWNGLGITSSAAAARAQVDGATGVGVISNDNLGYASFKGVTGLAGTASEVLLKYTFLGDSDLDGDVDGGDFTALIAGLSAGAGGWEVGDTDYNGIINSGDFVGFVTGLSAYQGNGPLLLTRDEVDGLYAQLQAGELTFAQLTAAVAPEPASPATLAALAAVGLRRRRATRATSNLLLASTTS